MLKKSTNCVQNGGVLNKRERMLMMLMLDLFPDPFREARRACPPCYKQQDTSNTKALIHETNEVISLIFLPVKM